MLENGYSKNIPTDLEEKTKTVIEPDVRVLVLSWVEQMNVPLFNFHLQKAARFPFPTALRRNPYLSI